MPGDGEPISEHSSELDSKQAAIETIMKNDKASFDVWVAHPDHKLKLNLPDSVLRTFIPRRLYDFTSNPSNVHAINLWEPRDSMCQMLFYIREDHPLSNSDSLAKYIQENRARKQVGTANGSLPAIPIPDDVDYEHLINSELIEQGKMTVFDKITNRIILNMPDPFDYSDVLQVGQYDDRHEMRGKGVATSFYTQLRSLAREMGFRFITGSNNDRNIGYFKNTLGRSTLADIRPEQRVRLGFPADDKRLEIETVDFLYPEDKEKFIK